MSGHSKWSSIKHQKGAADAKRGKIFTKLGHAITVAAREGGGNPDMSPRLALAIEMAKKNNMPKDNIDRAIKRGTGEAGGAAVEDIVYEGYGPGGTAIYIQALTDNRNRTVSEIRAAFNKHGGKIGEAGSVAYLFQLRGVITVAKTYKSIEELEMLIIESGAEDYEENEENFTVYTDPRDLQDIKQALETAGLTVLNAEQTFEPKQTIEITDEKIAGQIVRLITALEEIDDVADVASNVAMSDEVLAKLG